MLISYGVGHLSRETAELTLNLEMELYILKTVVH